MQQLQPITLSGKNANEKFRGSRRPDPYLRRTNQSFGSQTQAPMSGMKEKRGAKSIIPQSMIDDLMEKANKQEIAKKSRGSTKDFMSTQPTNRLPVLSSPTNIQTKDDVGTEYEFGQTLISSGNKTAKGGNRDLTANVMNLHANKYDIFNQYIHNVPQSDKIEQANQYITQFAVRKEGEKNLSIDEKIGAIIAQAQSRSLLGRGAGGFLRQKPVEGYSLEKKAQVVNGIIKDQLQQIKDPTDIKQLLNQRHKLGDEYLPSLRKFVPIHNQQELHRNYNEESFQHHLKDQQKKQKDSHKIKQGQQTKISIDVSLYEKQQQVLIQAQFQQPYKQEKLKATRQTRVEGWMLKELEQKLAQVKPEQVKEQAKLKKQTAEGQSSGSSYHSLGSSDEDSPFKAQLNLTNNSMQKRQKWNDVLDDENERLSKRWQQLFDKPLPTYVEGEVHAHQNVKTIKPKVKQEFTSDQYKQYYFDLLNKMNLVTDNLTEEEQLMIHSNMEVRIAKRNKNYLRIRELSAIVTDQRIKNLQALQDFEGKYTFETQREIELLIKKRQSLMEDAGDMNFCIYGEEKEEINLDHENFDQSAQRLMMITDKQVTMDNFGKNLIYDIIKLGIQEKRIDARVLNPPKKQTQDHLDSDLEEFQEDATPINKAVFKAPSIVVNNVPVLKLQTVKIPNKTMTKVETAASSFSSASKIEPPQKKTVFHQSIIKNRFYDLAKKTKHDEVDGEAFAMVKFFESCEQSQISAVPIFSKIYEGKLSIIGQYISKDLAKAIGELLQNLNDSKDLQFDELNFDYNGMKDDQFYNILKSLPNHKTVKKITYVNNEMGKKSIKELNKILSGENGIQLSELRLSGVKASSQDLELLLQGLQNANSLQCLKLSNLKINDPVLVRELTRGVHQLIELRELNLSYQGFLAIQLNQIMIEIVENYPKLVVLNLSGNPLPLRDNKHSQSFLDNLIKMIQNKVNRLADLDLSDMNLRDRVEKLAWPLAQNETLQSIHLSNNQIPQSILTDLLLVFGIKNSEKQNETFSHFKKTQQLKPRVVMKNGKLVVIKVQSLLGTESSQDIMARKTSNIHIDSKDKIINTLGEATAQIANSEQMKDAIEKKKYVQCQTKQGLLFTQVKQQCVVISRILCHNELIFNMRPEKNTHFEKGSGGKWRISDNCWLCDKHRYTVLVFNRELAQKHWIEITDPQRIQQIRHKYHLDDGERFVGEKADSVRIMGTITDHVVSNMLFIQLFNILLDNEGLVANFGEKAQSVTDEAIEVAFGEDRNLKKVMEEKNRTDSYKEMYSNLPFPASQVSIVGVSSKYELHGDNYDPIQLINTQSTERLKPPESLFKNENIFVLAGYMKPGKHQIILHDRKTDIYYARDIIIDIRTCEVLSNVYQNHNFYTSTVKKIFNPNTGGILMDLSSSVFMNFSRITTSTVNSCFTHDMQFCRMRNIIEDEDDLEQAKECILANYAIFVKFFHTMSAQFPEFPMIELSRLPQVLKMLDLTPLELAQEMLDGVLTKYKELRFDVHQGFRLNRMYFLEAILLYIDEIQLLERQKINENEQLKDIYMAQKTNLRFSQSLNSFLKAFQKYQNDEVYMENGLTKFRVQYVWVNSVNQVLYANLQGLMTIFNKYRPSDKGFTQRSAIKLLEDAKIKLSEHVAKRQFNLAQMTVFDELNASNEYLEMEFVEWLEFIVRVCYVHNKVTSNSDIQVVSHGLVFSMTEHEMESRLAQTVNELLQLVNVTYVEPAKVKVVPALEEKDYKKLALIK